MVLIVVQVRRGGRAGGEATPMQMAAADAPEQPENVILPSRRETAKAAKPEGTTALSESAKRNGTAALPLEGRSVQALHFRSPVPPRATLPQQSDAGFIAGQVPSAGIGSQRPLLGSAGTALAVEPEANASSSVISSGAAQPPRAVQGAPARPAVTVQAVPSPPALESSAASTVITGASLDALSDDTASFDAAPTPSNKSAGTLMARSSIQRPLPSGLPVLSSAASGQTMLALDSADTLFYSVDAGLHWKPVRAKWPGRAVHVALAVSPAAAVAVPVAAAKPATAQRQAVQMNAGRAAAPAKLQSKVSGGATLSGQVTDSAGAVVPNALVTIVNGSSSSTVMVKTDNAGRYLATGLAPGAYRISVTLPGFARREQTVTLAESQSARTDVKLQVGAATETVEVTSAAPPIETEDNSSRVAGMLKAKSKSSVPPVFAITTDSGQRWVSADGKSWKRE